MRLFISYARVDKYRIQELVDILEDAGHDPWFDVKLLPGEDWKAILLQKVMECDAFVYALTPDSVSSEWCRWEFEQAIKHEKPIIPILIHKKTEIPETIAKYQYADFSNGPTPKVVAQLMGGLMHIAISVPKQDVDISVSEPKGFPAQVKWTTQRRTISQQILKRTTALPIYQHELPSKPIGYSGGRIIGIDFGTTNSMCAVIDSGTGLPTVIPNAFGYDSTPSAVAIDLNGNPLVGEPALQFALQHPERAVLEVKRLFGEKHYLEVDNVSYDPATLASFVIKSLRADAEAFLDRQVSSAVLTAPAYFDRRQLATLRKAATLGGIETLRIIAEPTSACLGTGLFLQDNHSVAVFDLGGGTFDVSILETGDGVFEVRAISGDSQLGGLDYDKILLDYCVHEFHKQTGINLSDDLIALLRIRDACEKAKIVLSSATQTTVSVPYIIADQRNFYNLSVPLSRIKFQELTYHLVEQSIEYCRQALLDGELRPEEIDKVVLVGLSTKTPSVTKSVSEFFKKPPVRGVDPDKVVALGASVQAGVLEGTVTDQLLLDVISKTLGIELADGTICTIIKRNTTLPLPHRDQETHIFSTMRDDQTNIDFYIVEGDQPISQGSRYIGMVQLTEIPPMPRGTAQIEVTMDIDANNILTISFQNKATGKEVKKTLQDGEELLTKPLQSSLPLYIGLKGSSNKRHAEDQVPDLAEYARWQLDQLSRSQQVADDE